MQHIRPQSVPGVLSRQHRLAAAALQTTGAAQDLIDPIGDADRTQVLMSERRKLQKRLLMLKCLNSK